MKRSAMTGIAEAAEVIDRAGDRSHNRHHKCKGLDPWVRLKCLPFRTDKASQNLCCGQGLAHSSMRLLA